MRTVVVVILRGDGFLIGGVALGLAVASPKLVRRGELIERDFAGDGASGGGAVMLQEGVAVGAVGEGNVENLSLFEGLLHPGTDGVVVVLGFDHGEGKVLFVGK